MQTLSRKWPNLRALCDSVVNRVGLEFTLCPSNVFKTTSFLWEDSLMSLLSHHGVTHSCADCMIPAVWVCLQLITSAQVIRTIYLDVVFHLKILLAIHPSISSWIDILGVASYIMVYVILLVLAKRVIILHAFYLWCSSGINMRPHNLFYLHASFRQYVILLKWLIDCYHKLYK